MPPDAHPRLAVKIASDDRTAHVLLRERHVPRPVHTNIVPVLDGSRRFARPTFVVMPYLPGGSLADLMQQHPRGLPEMRCEALLKDILRGLDAAHRCGIVHRDLKPSNVLIDVHGHACLSDFGLSIDETLPDVVRSLHQSASLDAEHAVHLAGTLAYMAPEVRDGGPPTPAADIYSVGVMLFEMLTGRRPQGVEMPTRVRPNLRHPEYWDDLYRGACEGPAERFENAGMMLLALRSYGIHALHRREQEQRAYILHRSESPRRNAPRIG